MTVMSGCATGACDELSLERGVPQDLFEQIVSRASASAHEIAQAILSEPSILSCVRSERSSIERTAGCTIVAATLFEFSRLTAFGGLFDYLALDFMRRTSTAAPESVEWALSRLQERLHLLSTVTALVQRHYAIRGRSPVPHSPLHVARFLKLCEWLERHLSRTTLRQQDAAAALGLSSRELSRFLAEQVGASLTELTAVLRVSCALRNLADPQASIKEVAFAAGFGSVRSMQRWFWRFLRVSPQDTRLPRTQGAGAHVDAS